MSDDERAAVLTWLLAWGGRIPGDAVQQLKKIVGPPRFVRCRVCGVEFEDTHTCVG